MQDLVEFPDAPNNLLYDMIRAALVPELGGDWDEYGMTFEIHTVSGESSDLTGRVNFLEIETDDEADGTSTATELNLSEVDVDKLARFILEIVRDTVAGGFRGGDLRQKPNSDDTEQHVLHQTIAWL